MILEGKKDGWLRLPVNTLPAWAAFNNVQFNGIKVDAIPGLEDRGSTVVAKRHLSGGQEAPLMTVPKDLILSLERVQEHAKTDADFRTILEALGEFGKSARGAILSFLLMQSFTACPLVDKKRGVSTPFTDYVKFLPTELLPTFWTDDEQSLLTGTTLAPAITAKMNSLYREFERLRAATKDIAWCAEAWWDEVDGLLTFTDWLHVDAMYRSRALEFPGVGDCMVPCIDMANHASGSATIAIYEVDAEGNALLLLQHGKQIQENEEITITYGDNKGACEMLFSYGFIEDDMASARQLFLDLSIPEDDPLRRVKAMLADCAPGFKITEIDGKMAWEGDYIWLTCVNEEDGLQFTVRQTVDGEGELAAAWNGQELKSFNGFDRLLQQHSMWDIFRLRAVSILQDRVASQLSTLYASGDEIDKLEHGESSGIRQIPRRLAMKLRTLEGDLLEKAYEFFENLKVELTQSETVLAYLQGNTASETQDQDVEDFS